jgi:hypothetical protein
MRSIERDASSLLKTTRPSKFADPLLAESGGEPELICTYRHEVPDGT